MAALNGECIQAIQELHRHQHIMKVTSYEDGFIAFTMSTDYTVTSGSTTLTQAGW